MVGMKSRDRWKNLRLIGGHTQNVAIAIERGAAISAQPLDLRGRSTVWNALWDLCVKQITSGLLILQGKRTPTDLPIAIGARDLSAWSQRQVVCGEVVKGFAVRG